MKIQIIIITYNLGWTIFCQYSQQKLGIELKSTQKPNEHSRDHILLTEGPVKKMEKLYK